MGDVAPELRELAPGTMLDDKYRIDRLLAVGGMGAVYEGTHVKLRKRVAIKVLSEQLTSQAMIDRFHREAITASQIGHEGIAQVTDLGTSMTGEHFIVMELLEGEPLSARLKAANGPLPIEVACEMACAILSPLAAAHAAGIVHRDLKPDNVFLVRQSRGEMVKLLDFGISRAQGLEQEFRLTTTGLVLGTPYYMSPEQARGETAVGPAADLYAMGVMLYEMLVGVVPIKADNYNQLIYRVMTGDYARPRTKRAELPPPLEDIVMRAMALEPENRPRSAAELEQMLLAFCRPTFRDHMIERISQSSVGFSPSSPLLPTPQGSMSVRAAAPTAVKSKSKVIIPILIAGVAAAGIAVAVIVSKQSGSDEKKPEVAAKVEMKVEPAVVPPVAPPVEPAKVEPAKVAPEPAMVKIKFEVEPANAIVTVDGKPVTDNVFESKADEAVHKIAINAKGFQTYEEDVTLDENQKLVIKLDKVGAKPSKRPVKRVEKTDKPTGKKTDRIDTKSPYDP